MKKIVNKGKWFILHIEEIISCIALAVMIVAIFVNVCMRYVFRTPLAWADELAMICLAWVTFVGSAAAYKLNLHYGIDILLDKLPENIRMMMRKVTNLVFIFVFAYVSYLGVQLTASNMKLFHYSGWSFDYLYASVPVGFLSMTIYAVYYFILSFKNPEKYKQR